MANSSDEEEAGTEERFKFLCRDLNMDQETEEEAWRAFQKISTNYTLEGENLHWLACSLYVACRRSIHPTVDSTSTIEGNCVSLTRLLRAAKLSLIQFFNKMKKWLDMSNATNDFRKKVGLLERNFHVSTVIFKKFEPIFLEIFKDPREETFRAQRSRKSRKQPCSVGDLFAFIWTLYVQAKGNFPAISDDLVNSYHLLLCCLDLLYTNALYARHRKELLRQDFEGLPEDFGSASFKPPTSVPCIVERLCNRYQGIVCEAKVIKEHYWKPYIQKLFEKRTLKGNEENLTGILDQGSFEQNCKAINKEYEEYVLSAGDFDERIFLGDEAHLEIGTPAKAFSAYQSGINEQQRMGLRRNLEEHFSKTRSLAPQTPLTGRRYLKEKDPRITPVSTATQSVSRLQAMLSGQKPAPSERLQTIFRECTRNPQRVIENRVEELEEIFIREYVQPSPDRPNSPCSTREFASKRLKLAKILYYKILEGITVSEKKRLQGQLDLTTLLEQDVFHQSLLACCIEIVIFSYNSQRTFPWILKAFRISAYHFYKVIEVLVKAEEGLSREVVKHLNHIEEQILESMAWVQESPLWFAIQAAGSVPSCEDVTIPSHIESSYPNQNLLASPIIHPRIQRLCGEMGNNSRRINSPPNSPSQERLSSPVGSSGARRNLMGSFSNPPTLSVPNPNHSTVPRAVPLPSTSTSPFLSSASSQAQATGQPTLIISPASPSRQSYLQVNGVAHAVVIPSSSASTIHVSPRAGSGLGAPTIVASPVTSPVRSILAPTTPRNNSGNAAKPKKTGSLALFFRTVYHLASVRLRDLCSKLEISEELRGKIWTCFEHSLMHLPELMKDRHLDQLLMCAVYVMGKVTNGDLSFQNIMKCYRTQPQAASHVYRSVLLRSRKRRATGSTGSDSDRKGSKSEPGSSGPASPILGQSTSSARASPIRSASVVPTTPPPSGSAPPALPTGSGSSTENSPCVDSERGDLIEFYNKIYIKKIKNFALKFSPNDRTLDAPPLSPLPVVKNKLHSPRRQVSTKHPVYISPCKNGVPMTPTTRMLYCFHESPAKKLRDINSMVKAGTGEMSRKRALLQDDQDGVPPKRSSSDEFLKRKLTNMFEERQASR